MPHWATLLSLAKLRSLFMLAWFSGCQPQTGQTRLIHISRRVCRLRGSADVRPDFNWNRTATAMMG
jgi:hypothetical protein